jgi:hypothetical protein
MSIPEISQQVCAALDESSLMGWFLSKGNEWVGKGGDSEHCPICRYFDEEYPHLGVISVGACQFSANIEGEKAYVLGSSTLGPVKEVPAAIAQLIRLIDEASLATEARQVYDEHPAFRHVVVPMECFYLYLTGSQCAALYRSALDGVAATKQAPRLSYLF